MRRSSQFAIANTLRSSKCYVDQWNKVLALVNANGIIALAIKEVDGILYVKVASGDGYEKLVINGLRIGSMTKNMYTLMELYSVLRDDIITEKISNISPGCPKQLYVWEYLPHNKRTAINCHFRATDNSDVLKYTKKAAKIVGRTGENYSKKIFTFFTFSLSKSDCWKCDPSSEWGFPMYDVGDGVYCDDDGDNWDFY